MKISSKGRYAVRIMAELAKHDGEFVSVAELGKMQGIGVKYIEKIAALLLKANLILSVRGTRGGYRLAKSSAECSVREILNATGDLHRLAPCLAKGGCDRRNVCPSVGCWEKLGGLITEYLQEIKLADLIN